MTTKKLTRLFGVVPGIKTLITVSSFAATIIGWAWITGQDAIVAPTVNPPSQDAQALSTLPNTIPGSNRDPNNFSFQNNRGDLLNPSILRGITRSSR